MKSSNPRDHLIVALDVPDQARALALVDELRDHVGLFKIGLQLYTACGPSIVEEVQRRGCNVFLDLKLHDIPNTVASAVREAVKLGVQLLTVHTLGGSKMLSAAREAVESLNGHLKLLGVTVLTSMDQEQLNQLGFTCRVEELVVRLARLAESSGADGVVCSPLELDRLSKEGLEKLFFVTPGIRPAGANADDQSRILTPSEAISKGARYLVVGRPIIKAPQPAEAARRLLDEIRTGTI